MAPSTAVDDTVLDEEPPPSYEETVTNATHSTTLASGPSRPFQEPGPPAPPPRHPSSSSSQLPPPSFPFWNGPNLTPQQTGFNPGSPPPQGVVYHAPGAQNYAGVPTSWGWQSAGYAAQSPSPPIQQPQRPASYPAAGGPSSRPTPPPRHPSETQQQRIAYAPTDTPVPGQPLLKGNKIIIYPKGLWCTKCANSGYKAYDPSHPCRKCWDKFSQKWTSVLKHSIDPYKPPENWQRPLQAFASPTQGFTNATTGQKMQVWSGPVTQHHPPPNALVVRPGDPRIGGWLCPECGGQGDVPGLLFIDRTTCFRCRGAGRVF